MKLYKTYGACKRYQGSAYPVHLGPIDTRWTADRGLGEILEEAVFSSSPNPAFDRIIRLRALPGGEHYAVETILSREYPGEWPQLEIYNNCSDALAVYTAHVDSYAANPTWSLVSQLSE